ncbi:MAG: hypothetical protein WAU01_02780 [Saprospiraceae bacterium]
MNKHTKPTLKKLETIFNELDYIVRYEKGTFNSGYCLVENSKIVVVNKFFDTDGRVAVLMDLLSDLLDDEGILSDKSMSFYRHLIKKSEYVATETK